MIFERSGWKARIFDWLFWLVLFGWAVFLVGDAFGQGILKPIPSTPDISVSDSATSDIPFQQRARWLYLRNDCSASVYLDLTGVGDVFPLRLDQGDDFTAEIATYSVAVSPGAGASSCTITILPSR